MVLPSGWQITPLRPLQQNSVHVPAPGVSKPSPYVTGSRLVVHVHTNAYNLIPDKLYLVLLPGTW